MATYTATTNPMIISSAATVIATRPFLVKRIEWFAPQTAGNNCVIADQNGNVFVEGTCEVASQSQILWSGPQKLTLPATVGNAKGWQVSTIQSGSLIIWY